MSKAPTNYKISARSKKGGQAVALAKHEQIDFDASTAMGDELPGPAELLLTAFSACALKNVERFSELLPFQYEAASIEVEGERQDTPPKFTRIRYTLKLVTDEPEARLALLHKNIRKYGTITNTLAEACELDGKLIKVDSADEL